MWDEDRLRELDVVLHEASVRGVRLIIPILNQDFGTESTNWVGNIVDLMRYVNDFFSDRRQTPDGRDGLLREKGTPTTTMRDAMSLHSGRTNK